MQAEDLQVYTVTRSKIPKASNKAEAYVIAIGETTLPKEYKNFKDVFLEEKANKLLLHRLQDHAIELKGN